MEPDNLNQRRSGMGTKRAKSSCSEKGPGSYCRAFGSPYGTLTGPLFPVAVAGVLNEYGGWPLRFWVFKAGPEASLSFWARLVKVTERESPKSRFSRISPLRLETQASARRRKPQKTADFRRKPEDFMQKIADWASSP